MKASWGILKCPLTNDVGPIGTAWSPFRVLRRSALDQHSALGRCVALEIPTVCVIHIGEAPRLDIGRDLLPLVEN